MPIARHLKRVDPTPVAKAATGAVGFEPPSWAGYWTFVTATLILAFVLYLAKHGRLSVWLAFFTPQTPAPIANATGADSSAGASAAPSTNANPNATPANPLTGAIPSYIPGSSAGNFLTNFGTFLLHPLSGTK